MYIVLSRWALTHLETACCARFQLPRPKSCNGEKNMLMCHAGVEVWPEENELAQRLNDKNKTAPAMPYFSLHRNLPFMEMK